MRINQFLIAIGVGTMLAACSSDEMQTEKAGGIPINFTANIQNLIPSVGTRVADGTPGMDITSFPDNSEIRLGEGNMGTTDSYITKSSDGWEYTSSSEKQYLPANKESKRIVALFPAPSKSVSDLVNFRGDISVSTDQSAINEYKNSDILGAIATVTKSNAEAVVLNFKHLCAKVIVNVKNGSSNVSGYTITMKNIYTTAGIPISGGKFSFITENYYSNNSSVIFGVSSSTTGQAAIIIPQTISSGTALFDVTKEGVTYTFTTTEDITLQSGYSYTFNLKFEDTEIGFDNVSISYWGPDPDKPTIEGTLSEQTT